MKRTTWFACGLASVLLACGPVWMLPGGALSGEPGAVPTDWTMLDGEKTVQLEVQPSNPYSVNVWGVGLEDGYYIASGRGGDATWAKAIGVDPDVRLAIGAVVYELRADRVEGEEPYARFLAALERKYDFEPEPGQTEEAWLFRLGAR